MGKEPIPIMEAAAELFEAGPDSLAREIQNEEPRLPILGEIRREVEGTGDANKLRLSAARYLAFLETHPRNPGEPRRFLPPRLPDDPRQPRALPAEEQVHLLYLSIWRPEWLPAVERSFPWACSPVERAWARLHGRDWAGLPDFHYWLANGGRALRLPLGLLRLAVEEAVMLALDSAPEDFSHLDHLETAFLDDPVLELDADLGPVLRALRTRVSYYRFAYQYEAKSDDLLAFARQCSALDLSGDPHLAAQFRLRVLRGDKGSAETKETQELRERLAAMLEADGDSAGQPSKSVLRVPSRVLMERELTQLDREVGTVRGEGISRLDEALRDERPQKVLPEARAWLWANWQLPEESSRRARVLLARVSSASARCDHVCIAYHLHGLALLPTAPLESSSWLRCALRLCGSFATRKTRVICDLLIVAWLFGLPVDHEEDLRIDLEQPGHSREGRIIGALCPALGLLPVRLLPKGTYGVHRLLRAMQAVPRSNPTPSRSLEGVQ